jgi:hypothetical protein
MWYKIRMDTCFTVPYRIDPVPDKYCVDLNDNFFVPGDTVLFFYGAINDFGADSYFSEFTGTVQSIDEAANKPMEFQILPSAALMGGDILYVDDSGQDNARTYFDWAFKSMGIFNEVDRYDVRGAFSCEGNSPGGSGVKDIAQQLLPYYRKIIWNTGNLRVGTIGDGSGEPEKAADAQLLFAFLDFLPTSGGVYLSGDNIAEEWDGRPFLIAYNLVSGDHTLVGHGTSPLSVGMPGSMFEHAGGPDTLVAYGGGPTANDFDVMEPVGITTGQMSYDDTQFATDQSVIAMSSTNSLSQPVGVVLSGFSFHYIRDDRPTGIPDRADHLWHILTWLGNIVETPVGVDQTPMYENSLAQNYPNPCNPNTTIRYAIRERGHVSLMIYDVAGRLIKTMVNEVQFPRAGGYAPTWNGTNENGEAVASGVYFYRLVAKNFAQTRKLVLIK